MHLSGCRQTQVFLDFSLPVTLHLSDFNTEACGGAGRVLGDLLRGMKQLPARFQMLPTQSDSVGLCEGDEADSLPQLGLPALGRFPQFSAFAYVRDPWPNSGAENSRNRPNMAIFTFQPLAGALLQNLQPSTECACSLDHSPKAKH